MYCNKENVNILTSLLVAYGVEHVVACPGSRNAPLVHNFNECPQIECHPVTDERSAAFVTLGLGLKTNAPVAVCVTSGSALLNVLAGVAEASYQKNGIIVISADRPGAWIDQLDGQTMPQVGALGSFVAKSVSLPECHTDEDRWHCRRLVCEAMLALSASRKSVHINVPISEPLFEFTCEQLPEVKRVMSLRWDNTMHQDFFLGLLSKSKKPMLVVGQTHRGTIADDTMDIYRESMVVLAEPLSADYPSPSLDDMFSNMDTPDDYKPDLLIYVGGTTISKKLRQFLRSLDECKIVMVNPLGELEDISQHADFVLIGNPMNIMGELSCMLEPTSTAFMERWEALEEQTREQLDSLPLSLEAQAVRLFEEEMTEDDDVFYANSSSVRLAARFANHFVYCNRGLNGIEGSLSTAVGFSLASDENVYCVIGDLSFFYDQNALWNQHLRGNLRILLLNNGGGKIFQSLPNLDTSPARDELVMAKHNTTAEGACLQYGIAHRVVRHEADLPAAINWLVGEPSHRPVLLEVITE